MPENQPITIGDLTFNCLVAGNPKDPLVMLMHGFPESSYMWRRLMDQLSGLGYYCVAPDMRGYSPHACPEGKRHYTMDLLAQDIVDIASRHHEKFHLIAHDWGAGIGWFLVHEFPDLVLSYSALSVPHNSAFGKAYRTSRVQMKMSRYILWILIPVIPELRIRWSDFRRFRELWKDVDQQELDHNLSIFRRKKSLRAALNYYRANVGRGKSKRIGKIKTPVLFIWGNEDFAVSRAAADFNHDYMEGPYEYLEVQGGHWLIQTNYKEVSEAIIKHLERWGNA